MLTCRRVEQVRTTEEFVEYLQAKSPEIRLGYLPFEGRNKLLYTLPPLTAATAAPAAT